MVCIVFELYLNKRINMNSISIDQFITETEGVLIPESKILVNLSNFAYYTGTSEDIVVLNRLLLEYAISFHYEYLDGEHLYMQLCSDLQFNSIFDSLVYSKHEAIIYEQLLSLVTSIQNSLDKYLYLDGESRFIIEWKNPLDYVCIIADFEYL